MTLSNTLESGLGTSKNVRVCDYKKFEGILTEGINIQQSDWPRMCKCEGYYDLTPYRYSSKAPPTGTKWFHWWTLYSLTHAFV